MLTHGFDNVRGYEYAQRAPLKSTPRPAPSSAAVAAISASVRSAQWTRFRACAVGAARRALRACFAKSAVDGSHLSSGQRQRRAEGERGGRGEPLLQVRAHGALAGKLLRAHSCRWPPPVACALSRFSVLWHNRGVCVFSFRQNNALTPPLDCVLVDVEFRACCRHTLKQFRLASAASSLSQPCECEQLPALFATFRMAKHGRTCSLPRCLIRHLCYTLLLPNDGPSVRGEKRASVNAGDAAKMPCRIRVASLKA